MNPGGVLILTWIPVMTRLRPTRNNAGDKKIEHEDHGKEELTSRDCHYRW
jgi:hypothetical protein